MKMIKRASTATAALVCLAGLAYGQSMKDATRAIEVEQYEKAKAILSKLAQAPEAAAESDYYMGTVYVKTGELDSAQVFFTKGVASNPQFPLNYIGQGLINASNNNMASASALFDKALSLDNSKKKDYRPFMEASRAYAVAGASGNTEAIEKAIQYGEEGKKWAPKSAEAHAAAGDAYMLKLDANNGIANYNKALDLDKNYLAAYVAQSHIYRSAKNYQAAIEPLEKALAIDANYGPAYRELAELYYSSGQYAKGVDLYKNKYMPLTDASCNSQTRYAQFLFLAKQYQEAYDELNRLINSCPVKPVMYRLKGYSAFEIKKNDEALATMNTFFEKQPATNIITQDYEYMANILSANGQDSLAIGYLQKALDRDSTKTDLYPFMGKMAYISKQYPAAITTYEKYFTLPDVKAAPTDYLYYGLSAMMQQTPESYMKADSAFGSVAKLSPTYIPAFVYRAQVNSYMDSDPIELKGLAKPYYDKVIELALADPAKNGKYLIEAYRYMADYSFRLEKNNEATKSFFAKILELDPEDTQATDAMNQLNAPQGKK